MEPLTIGDSAPETDSVPADFTLADDPFALFAAWMKEAEAAEPEDPNAMALATASALRLSLNESGAITSFITAAPGSAATR